ncbi:MAG TPA: hypothetical protein ENJ74_00970 [Nitratifractor salsuginis]|uniref:DUF945 domain-containing protein n=1 Tax=Nitratifractor salsuginis TaxID=269261 RepID=A0A7V2WLA3_9BACT|nr:hypothetical protein [Nitratifractor salsuginis]
MKKKILGVLAVGALLFLGWRASISSHGETYLKEVIAAYNKGQRGEAVADIRHFANGFSSASAELNVTFPGVVKRENFPLKDPLIVPARLRYGPLIGGWTPGLMEIRIDETLNEMLKPEVRRKFESRVAEKVRIRYRGILDWSRDMHEEVRISRILAKDPKDGSTLKIEPILIRSDYALKSLAGRAKLSSAAVEFRDGKRGEELTIGRPELSMEIQEFTGKGPIFGRFVLQSPEIAVRSPREGLKEPLHFASRLEMALLHTGKEQVELDLGFSLKARDEVTRRYWKGVRSQEGTVKLQSLGLQGIRDLAAMQEEQLRIQKELAKATAADDDIAMQKAILALQALNGRWVQVYNDLLIPGKTRLLVDETLDAAKTSRLKLDLTYTGKPLQGNAMSAMIELMAHADRLAEGSFELTLEKELARKLYPNAVFVLDSMVSKNMATLKEGLYRLKGEIKEGKIIINGTRYAPQELIMMILM